MSRRTIPLVAFTLAGPMAHFRKFYTTTSALSYPFPPRTTLMGLVAGILGIPRDTYYENLSSDKLWISVRILTPVRTRVFTVNYLFTKYGDLYHKGRGTQIPVEWVLPRPPHRAIRYRVYLSSPEPKLWKRIVKTFRKHTFLWPVYMGVTEALAWIEDIWIGEALFGSVSKPVPVATPLVHSENIQIKLGKEKIRLILDRMTRDFSLSPYRSPLATLTILYEAEGRPFRALVPYPLFSLPEDSSLYGGFLHEVFLPP